jgi:hypothetical protein
VRALTIAHALAMWDESGVRVRKKTDVAGESEAMHWQQPKGGRKGLSHRGGATGPTLGCAARV